MQQHGKQSIGNVLLWPILTIAILSSTGCASIGNWFSKPVKPIEVVTKPVERPPLAVIDPEPINATGKRIEWFVITPDNAAQTFERVESPNKVLFGLTTDGYQELSLLMAEIRVYITTQRHILQKYKEYYENPVKNDSAKDQTQQNK